MLQEVISKRLPVKMRRFKCTVCGKYFYAHRDKDIEFECCGWSLKGKDELKSRPLQYL